MAPKQKKFTVVPDATGIQGLMSRPAGPSSRPAMTSKQAQKSYRERTRGPRLSKAEQRLLELREQERIRKELEKDKQAAKARAAREKKKAKEQQVLDQKKKKGLPLVNVRPSQDTISRFLRKVPACTKKRPSESLDAVPEEAETRDKENEPPEKRQRVERLGSPAQKANSPGEQANKDCGKVNGASTEASEAPSENDEQSEAGGGTSVMKPHPEELQHILQETDSANIPVPSPGKRIPSQSRQHSSPTGLLQPLKSISGPTKLPDHSSPSVPPAPSLSPIIVLRENELTAKQTLISSPATKQSRAVLMEKPPLPRDPVTTSPRNDAPNLTPATIYPPQIEPSPKNLSQADSGYGPSSGLKAPEVARLEFTSARPLAGLMSTSPPPAECQTTAPKAAEPAPWKPDLHKPSPVRASIPRSSPPSDRSSSVPAAAPPMPSYPAPQSIRTEKYVSEVRAESPAAAVASRGMPPKIPLQPLTKQPLTKPRAETRAPAISRTASEPPKPPPQVRPSLVLPPAPRAHSTPAAVNLGAQAGRQEVPRSPASRPPAAVRAVEKNTASTLSPAQFAPSPKTTPGPAFKPPRPPLPRSPLAGPGFKTPGGTANAGPQRSKFLPKHLQPSASKGFRGVGSEKPPTSTQLFLAAHIDDILPSPTQEARELQEPIPKGPAVPKFITKRAAPPVRGPPNPQPRFLSRQAAHVFTGAPKKPPQSEVIPFISTQDLCFSTQDLRDIETPTKKKQGVPPDRSRAYKPNTGAGRVDRTVMGPPPPKRPPDRVATEKGTSPTCEKRKQGPVVQTATASKVEREVMGPPPSRRSTDGVARETGASYISGKEEQGAPTTLSALVNAGRNSGRDRCDIAATQETDYGEFDINDYLGLMGDGL
ncbi:hypothetical protein QBC34DRAFT_406399 [Podospora aff. communis PSN243]|uniref:Uncharacterized protein n=1 Tax=Podospora aff. communis PSN243 TaxID=3040156 RepID=A0AAV9GMJ3_9PEZI|nr:hypothetical protein QBC34DRAFT_406399 [Podospora aff. communis PSN243]